MPFANCWRGSIVENSTAEPNGAPVPSMNEPGDQADDQRGSPAVANGLA